MKSNVGTLVYSCPEIVKNEPYGEQADIWAIGCILYQVRAPPLAYFSPAAQMAALVPPFYTSNMLARRVGHLLLLYRRLQTLAKKIVEAEYAPLPDTYSEDLRRAVQACLTPDGRQRPDIIQVAVLLVALTTHARSCVRSSPRKS